MFPIDHTILKFREVVVTDSCIMCERLSLGTKYLSEVSICLPIRSSLTLCKSVMKKINKTTVLTKLILQKNFNLLCNPWNYSVKPKNYEGRSSKPMSLLEDTPNVQISFRRKSKPWNEDK